MALGFEDVHSSPHGGCLDLLLGDGILNTQAVPQSDDGFLFCSGYIGRGTDKEFPDVMNF